MAYQGHDFPPQRLKMWLFDNTTGRCGSRMHHMKATDLLSPHPPSFSHFLFESRYINCSLPIMSHQSHFSQLLLVPNCPAKALASTSQHDCQDLFTPLPCHTITMFIHHSLARGSATVFPAKIRVV